MTEDLISIERWEALCKACGECCLEKIEDERGTIFYTMKPCRYLDVETRLCKVYDKRFAINPDCVKLTPELVSTLRWLPGDCGYVSARQEAPPPSSSHEHGRRRKGRS
jgi:uncharacterized cysteine cluster protein YcgN (CxxCxxCC family)